MIQVNDLKNRVSEKNGEIEVLKNEVKVGQERYDERVREQVEVRKGMENRIREYKKALGMVQKVINTLITDLRK